MSAPNNQSISQSINQSMEETANQSNHSEDLSQINQSVEDLLFTNQSVNQSINQPIAQPINQSIDQSINQSIDQSINQSIYQCKLTEAPLHSIPEHEFMRHSIDQSINQSTNQSVPLDVIDLIVQYSYTPHQSINQSLIDRTSIHWFAVLTDDVTCVKKQCSGVLYKDSFDAQAINQSLIDWLIRGWRIRSIRIWEDQSFVRGISFVYGPPTNHTINRSINQPINQSVNRSVSQSINQSVNQSIGKSVSQSTNHSSSQSINQPFSHSAHHNADQSISQPINHSSSQSINQSENRTFEIGSEHFSDLDPSFHRLIDLNEDEHITSMTGTINQSINQWISRLCITTNQSRVFEAGPSQSINQSIAQSVDFLPHEKNARILALRIGIGTHQPENQPIIQPINQSINQPLKYIDYLGCWFERMFPRTQAEIDEEEKRNTPSISATAFHTNVMKDY